MRPLPLAAIQDPGYRQLGVVVEDRARHPTKEGQGRVMPVEEGLDTLGRVGLDEAGVGVRQVEAEEVEVLAALAGDHCHRLAEVDLRMAGRMDEGDEHLPHPLSPLADIVLHDRVATGKAMLGVEALVIPPGRVPLLGRCGAVRLQDRVDDRGESPELGACGRLGAPVARRTEKASILRTVLRWMPKRRAASRWLSPSTWQAWRTRP